MFTATNNPIKSRLARIAKPEQAYSFVGALWQESAISRIDYKGSPAHQAIGRLVTQIHTGLIDAGTAEQQFVALLQER